MQTKNQTPFLKTVLGHVGGFRRLKASLLLKGCRRVNHGSLLFVGPLGIIHQGCPHTVSFGALTTAWAARSSLRGYFRAAFVF